MKRREFLTVASVAGGAGAVAPSAAAQSETPTSTGEGSSTETGNGTATSTGAESGGAGPYTRTVEMTDSNIYDPETLEVLPGDTVVWENVGSAGHTITAYEEEIPEGADYWASGGFDSEEAARDGYPDEGVVEGGGSYEYTFETEGTHGYFCIPHETAGMVGEIVVTPDAATPTPASSGGGAPAERQVNPEHMGVPFQAHFVGLATGLMMVVSLVFTFYVLKYGESANTKGGSD